MTIRIVVGLFAIFATGLFCIAAPVEAFARGGAFAGARAMSLHRGFSVPVIRPAIARPHRVAAPELPHRVEVPPRVRAAPLGHFRHRHVPVEVWVGAPWYGGYD